MQANPPVWWTSRMTLVCSSSWATNRLRMTSSVTRLAAQTLSSVYSRRLQRPCPSRLTASCGQAAPARPALTRRRCGCTCAGACQGYLAHTVHCTQCKVAEPSGRGALSLAQLEAKHAGLRGRRLSASVWRRQQGLQPP